MIPDRGSCDSASVSPSELHHTNAFLQDKVHKSLCKCDSEDLKICYLHPLDHMLLIQPFYGVRCNVTQMMMPGI